MGGTVRPSAFAVLQVDDEFKLGRLLDRQVRRLCALEDLVRIASGPPIQIS